MEQQNEKKPVLSNGILLRNNIHEAQEAIDIVHKQKQGEFTTANIFKQAFNDFFTKASKERRVIRMYTGVAGFNKIKQFVKTKQTIRRWKRKKK